MKSLSIYFLFFCFLPGCFAQTSVKRLHSSLTQRLEQAPKSFSLAVPPIIHDTTLVANAKYEAGFIYLGNVQRIFSTFDDSLSIMYHEYIHALLEKTHTYKIGVDEDGKILQWDTGMQYSYQPSEAEVRLYLSHFEEDILPEYPDFGNMAASHKQQIIASMRRDFSKKENMAFIYAPSNLAKEEIYAYQKQLEGEKLGLYTLSQAASMGLRIRLNQLKGTYKRRRSYEKAKGLKRSGEKKFEISRGNE